MPHPLQYAAYFRKYQAFGFAAAFTQQNRLIAMRFSDSATEINAHNLLPARLKLVSGLSEDFEIELVCLCDNADIEQKTLLGQPIEISVLLQDGSYKIIAGVVLAVADQGTAGKFIRLVLTVGSIFQTLKHRTTSRVFQHMSVPDIVEKILIEHRQTNPIFANTLLIDVFLTRIYPKRDLVIQYNESDYVFIKRLLAEEGITYLHRSDGPGDPKTSRLSCDERRYSIMHQFVLIDCNESYPKGQEETVVFGIDGKEGQVGSDTLTSFTGKRELTSFSTTLRNYNHHTAQSVNGKTDSAIMQRGTGDDVRRTLEDYRALASFDTPDDLQRLAKLRQQMCDVSAKQFTGAGTLRALDVGTVVTIQNHPVLCRIRPEDRQFLITAINVRLRNNLPDELAAACPDFEDEEKKLPCTVSFEAIRKHIQFAPAMTEEHRRPRVSGCLTATVVGPDSEEIYTDELGRIKIQFHFVRSKEHPTIGADYNENSFPWVRVANSLAGDCFGTQFIPRVGQEVRVEFIDGDINHPVVAGVLHNGTHANPYFSGVGSLPANKALSGFKTQGVKDHQNYNELLFDDTTGQSRTKLSSESGKTQLNLGYLVHPRTNGYGELRGRGFELRTDQYGVLRAAQGIFITADSRPNAAGKQLDRQEAAAQLHAAQQMAQSLASEPEQVSDQQQKLKEAIEQWDGSVLSANQGAILLSGPAGIAAVTPNSMTIATGTNLDQVAQRDTNQSTGRHWVHNVGESISQFVRGAKDKVSMSLIAAKGHLHIEAQDGNANISASDNINLVSTDSKIAVSAKDEILLTCGGGYIRICNGNIDIHTPGTVSVKGAKRVFSDGTKLSVAAQQFPEKSVNYDQEFILQHVCGEPMRNRDFVINFDDGGVIKGVCDANGRTGIKKSVLNKRHNIFILPSKG